MKLEKSRKTGKKALQLLLQITVVAPKPILSRTNPKSSRRVALLLRGLPIFGVLLLLFVAGCGLPGVIANSSNATFSISPGSSSIDTNCTGCNATNSQGRAIHQFTATLFSGGAASVSWSVTGGDTVGGPGTISASGQYTPPSYITADRVEVQVIARLQSDPTTVATSVLNLTPGFRQPLTPENLALGANGSATITGYLAEAGGTAAIDFALANTATGVRTASGSLGTLGPVNCQRDAQTFTYCTVTYTAPATIPSSGAAYVVATVGTSSSRTAAAVLLNTAGVSSNPASHQGQQAPTIQLGSSGGNNNDYDLSGSRILDCCSGTLGALLQDSASRLYLLSNNHVLARSDHASVGDSIIQPGLIDNNCTPVGVGSGVTAIATLNSWLPLSSKGTNADVAIAQVTSRMVDSSGSILELGARQSDGTLAAAPPGISSTNGKGEAASLSLKIAKSGRTTGLTCGSVSALDLDVTVDYYLDCAETQPYLSKTFTNQLAVSGNAFSDAGDSGSLLVDASNAEPVGLFFAGGRDVSGVSQAIANPATDVVSELSAQAGGGTAYSFVGAADHAVSCLSYGDSTVSAAQARSLASAEIARGKQALVEAGTLVNPSGEILAVTIGKSSDHPGEAAVIVYVDENLTASVPATVGGVRTVVIPTTARALSLREAPRTPLEAGSSAVALSASTLNQAIAIKRQVAPGLMKRNAAFFGVGVGQSLDNPKEAALVVYVDRQRLPSQLPATIDGLRIRYVVMDRLHVTRSYATPAPSQGHCMAKPAGDQATHFDLLNFFRPRSLKLN